MAASTIEKVKHPATIGDLVVIETAERSAGAVSMRYDVAEVANVFRSGLIKRVRRLDYADAYAEELRRWVGYQQCWLVRAGDINKAAAVEAIRAHRWPTALDSQMIMPWSDPYELRKLLARFRTAKTSRRVA